MILRAQTNFAEFLEQVLEVLKEVGRLIKQNAPRF